MKRIGMAWRLALAVVVGAALGALIGAPLIPLGDAAMSIVRLLKMLAAPLLFFAIVDALVKAEIPPRKGLRLVALSALNATVAVAIGLFVAHVIHAGDKWQGRLQEMLAAQPHVAVAARVAASAPAMTFPATLVDVLNAPSVIPLVLLALAVGIALRQLGESEGAGALARAAHTGFAVFARMLSWLVEVVPLAVCLIIAGVVAKSGFAIFGMLGWFVLTVTVGMVLHAGGYYTLLLLAARRSPRQFYARGASAILTALSCGSSLATLPVTPTALRRMKISEGSARLAACVGTNLNHDGIILYEAASALFVSQALGWHLGVAAQVQIAVASVLAGVGISGVPEAGLITLPLVLSAAGVPSEVVVALLPLLFAVDWLIGRMRAAVNVTSDMVVANLLEG